MRSFLIAATAVSAAIALGACHDKKPEPVPGPQSTRLERHVTADSDGPETRAQRGVSEINWFPDTLEKAFAGQAPRRATKAARQLISY